MIGGYRGSGGVQHERTFTKNKQSTQNDSFLRHQCVCVYSIDGLNGIRISSDGIWREVNHRCVVALDPAKGHIHFLPQVADVKTW